MNKFPEDKDKQVTRRNWTIAPYNRYAMCNINEVSQTRRINGSRAKNNLKYNLDNGINEMLITDHDGTKYQFDNYLKLSNVDGIIISKDNEILYEKYLGALDERKPHMLMSASKTFTAICTLILSEQGIIDLNEQITTIIPELADTAYDGYTIQNALDMQIPVKFSEDYDDPNAEIWDYAVAMGGIESQEYQTEIPSIYNFLMNLQPLDCDDKDTFRYVTPTTDVIAWIIKRVTGKNLSTLFEELIYNDIDSEYDAYWQLDPLGSETAGTGLNLTLRDAYRLAQKMLDNFNGKAQIGDVKLNNCIEYSKQFTNNFARSNQNANIDRQGWAYANQIWYSNNNDDVFMAIGFQGQLFYMNPKKNIVIVKFCSNDTASGGYLTYSANIIHEIATLIANKHN